VPQALSPEIQRRLGTDVNEKFYHFRSELGWWPMVFAEKVKRLAQDLVGARQKSAGQESAGQESAGQLEELRYRALSWRDTMRNRLSAVIEELGKDWFLEFAPVGQRLKDQALALSSDVERQEEEDRREIAALRAEQDEVRAAIQKQIEKGYDDGIRPFGASPSGKIDPAQERAGGEAALKAFRAEDAARLQRKEVDMLKARFDERERREDILWHDHSIRRQRVEYFVDDQRRLLEGELREAWDGVCLLFNELATAQNQEGLKLGPLYY
jgi:hypothetical protein